MAVSWTRPPGPAATGPLLTETHANLGSDRLPLEVGLAFDVALDEVDAGVVVDGDVDDGDAFCRGCGVAWC